MSGLNLILAQANPVVGDLAGNRDLARRIRKACGDGDLILFPELFLSGYPPEDLVLRPALLRAAAAIIEELAADTADGGPAMLIGAPLAIEGKPANAVALLEAGKVAAVTRKVDLPNYGVFDEKRVFTPGPPPEPMYFRGHRLGVPVCEDIWSPEVCRHLAEHGAEILLVPNGSPFESDKDDRRVALARARVEETGLPLVYLNQVGGQDELVFDGASFALGCDGHLRARLAAFREATGHLVLRRSGTRLMIEPGERARQAEDLEAVYRAMCLGLGDYVRKNGFPGVILGLSGGIDSALAAAVAVDALGPDRVRAVMMPSRYTSRDSLEDAAAVAQLLGIRLDTIAIEPAMAAFEGMLAPHFSGRAPDITEENIQSRIRGLLLMAISNKDGPMVLSTGNKSEMSVGYATLYGDMCGGYAVLKDVYKMTVFALSAWRNANHPEGGLGPRGPVMPRRVIDKPPSAELRDDQKDEDSLPPYALLDPILEGLIEEEASVGTLIARGFDVATVRRVKRLLDRAEYKRRQAPPGVKLTPRAFGRDRRYPITNRFED